MRYRIQGYRKICEDGTPITIWVPQRKYPLWPFWFTFDASGYGAYGGTVQFDTFPWAQDFIKKRMTETSYIKNGSAIEIN